MSTISNRFMVTAIEDGSTLHGTLLATKSLAQSYNNGSCSPDWSVAANQPTIYVSLFNGTQRVVPDASFTWYYNGTAIQFAANDVSTDGKFLKTTYNVGTEQEPLNVPALKIVENLASSDNLNVDVIRFDGAKTISTAPIGFSASIEVRITEWVSGGYLGTLSYQSNAVIDNEHTTVTLNALLYNDSGSVNYSEFTTEWYINDSETPLPTSGSGSTADIDPTTHVHYAQIKESDVVDYATIKCVFKVGGSVVWTEYIGVDDTSDPEFMYIQQVSGTGNAASLRTGESVTFNIWVNTMDDPTLKPNSPWRVFKVLLLDSAGQPVTENLSSYGITGAIDQNGYRNITRVLVSDTTIYKGVIEVRYSLVEHLGKNLTGLVMASTE